MNYQEPIRTCNIDLNKIVYPKIKNSGTKKLVLIKYNEKSKLKNFVFQTPTLLNLFKPELNGNYTDIEIELVGKEKSKVNKFKKFLNELEDKIKLDAQSYANTWFNLENNEQHINFQKVIRDSDAHPEGIIKVKIIKNNDFETFLQLKNSKRINITDVPGNSWCKMILECYGIWINSNNDFGIFFRPILISFTPKEKEVYNYKFIEDSDDDGVDIFDTEVNQNIFMKIEPSVNKKQNQNNDSTSQLDYNEIIKELELELKDNKTSDIVDMSASVLNHKDNLLDINLKDIYSSDSNTSDDEKSSLSPDIDAETSDN
jgi:hypothetical protein